jgi:ATP phosphoribosyltransferase regulatory subunit
LQQRIAALRGRGIVVVEDLPGHARHRLELDCDRELIRRKGRWVMQKRD